MTERKGLNKYISSEIDPDKHLPPEDDSKIRTVCGVRMMLPMTVKCMTCDEYMSIGKKFNMKMEIVLDEDYLGISIYRFYFKCSKCYSTLTFKTDPKNNDYICETGLRRKHQMWKDMNLAEEEFKEKRSKEMKEDAMKSLEYKRYDAKVEMNILDAIDQIRNINKRLGFSDINDRVLELLNKEDTLKELKNEDAVSEISFNDDEFEKKVREIKSKRLDNFYKKESKIENIYNKFYSKYMESDSDSEDSKNKYTRSRSISLEKNEKNFLKPINVNANKKYLKLESKKDKY